MAEYSFYVLFITLLFFVETALATLLLVLGLAMVWGWHWCGNVSVNSVKSVLLVPFLKYQDFYETSYTHTS